jgi:hypothetical protein
MLDGLCLGMRHTDTVYLLLFPSYTDTDYFPIGKQKEEPIRLDGYRMQYHISQPQHQYQILSVMPLYRYCQTVSPPIAHRRVKSEGKRGGEWSTG